MNGKKLQHSAQEVRSPTSAPGHASVCDARCSRKYTNASLFASSMFSTVGGVGVFSAGVVAAFSAGVAVVFSAEGVMTESAPPTPAEAVTEPGCALGTHSASEGKTGRFSNGFLEMDSASGEPSAASQSRGPCSKTGGM